MEQILTLFWKQIMYHNQDDPKTQAIISRHNLPKLAQALPLLLPLQSAQSTVTYVLVLKSNGSIRYVYYSNKF